MVDSMIAQLSAALFEPLRVLEPEYVRDNWARDLANIISSVAKRWENIINFSLPVATQMVSGVDQAHRERFYNSVEQSIGINLNGIIQEEGLQPTLDARIAENVSLIQTIPDKYFADIEQIVMEGTQRQQSAQKLIQAIIDKSKSTRARAKLIARDQVQKTNAVITQARQEALGVEEYVWRTSEDERVRDSHRRKNGRTYRWDDPPADTGHPGWDIQCRCYAAPVIKLD
jgi:SPP1 gp7 family putative phage head morphogenesis protein